MYFLLYRHRGVSLILSILSTLDVVGVTLYSKTLLFILYCVTYRLNKLIIK